MCERNQCWIVGVWIALTLICSSFCTYTNWKRFCSPTRIKSVSFGNNVMCFIYVSLSLSSRALQPSGVGDDVCHVSYSRGGDCVRVWILQSCGLQPQPGQCQRSVNTASANSSGTVTDVRNIGNLKLHHTWQVWQNIRRRKDNSCNQRCMLRGYVLIAQVNSLSSSLCLTIILFFIKLFWRSKK